MLVTELEASLQYHTAIVIFKIKLFTALNIVAALSIVTTLSLVTALLECFDRFKEMG